MSFYFDDTVRGAEAEHLVHLRPAALTTFAALPGE